MVRVPIWRKILVSTALHCLHTCTRGGSSLSYVKHDIIVLIQHCKKKTKNNQKSPNCGLEVTIAAPESAKSIPLTLGEKNNAISI